MYNRYMRGIFLLTLLFLSISCTKWSEVTKGNGIHVIDEINVSVHTLKESDWKVGRKRGATVSKGFTAKIDIPKISKDGVKELYDAYGIDSWLYKVSKVSRGRKQQLGLIQFNLANITRNTNNLTIQIYYHAASISKRFRNFHCPAFDHRLYIDDIELESDSDGKFKLYTRKKERVRGRISKPSFTPVIMSADRKMKGKYIIEIALFNSKNRYIYTPFQKLSNYIDVKKEVTVSVPSCIGIKEENKPLPESRTPSIRDLEIK